MSTLPLPPVTTTQTITTTVTTTPATASISFQQEFVPNASQVLSSTCTTLTNEGVWSLDIGSNVGHSSGWPPAVGSSGAILFDCGNGNVALHANAEGFETPTFILPSAFDNIYPEYAPGQAGYANDPCNQTSLVASYTPLSSGTPVHFNPSTTSAFYAYDYCITFANWQSSSALSMQLNWTAG